MLADTARHTWFGRNTLGNQIPGKTLQFRLSRRQLLTIAAGTGLDLVVGSLVVDQFVRPPMDRFEPGSSSFYRRLGPGEGASEVEHYDSIDQLTRSRTAVVLATLADVIETRVIHGEGNHELHMIGVVLEPADVLHGRWVQKYKGRLTVEFIGGGEGSSPD
jgi:hypothetical protein